MTMLAPITNLRERYGELLAVCDAVESIIDSIAGGMDRDLCIATATKISAMNIGRVVEVPPSQRTAAMDGAHEVAAALYAAASGRSPFSWEAIDSMLRIFLDGLRRHVAAEQAAIEAVLRSKLPQ